MTTENAFLRLLYVLYLRGIITKSDFEEIVKEAAQPEREKAKP